MEKEMRNKLKEQAEEMAAVNDRIFKEWQSKRTCKNCVYRKQYGCGNLKVIDIMEIEADDWDSIRFNVPSTFGCNQWRKKNGG